MSRLRHPPWSCGLVALWLLCRAQTVCAADEKDFQQTLAAAQQARAERKSNDAARLAAHAIQTAASLPAEVRPVAEGEAWNLLGLIHWETNDKVAAIEDFGRALAAYERAGDRTLQAQATTLLNLGMAQSNQQRFDEAIQAHRRRLAILESQQGRDSPDLTADLDRLAGAYLATKRYPEAEATLARMRVLREKASGAQSEPVAQVIDALAGTLERQERHAEAEPLFRESLAIRRQLRGDSAHEDVINSLFRLADNRRLAGDLRAAQDLMQQTDDRIVKRFGADSDQRRGVVKLRQEIANGLGDAATRSQCEQVLARLDAIHRWSAGEPQPKTGSTADQAAATEQALARFVESAREFGPQSQPVFTALVKQARWLQLQGRPADALPLFEQLLTVGRALYSEDHPEVAAVHFLHAESRRAMGQRAEAAKAYSHALQSNEKSGVAEPTIKSRILVRLAQLHFEDKRFTDAVPLYEGFLRTQQVAGSAENVELGVALNQLALCYAGLDRWGEALPRFRQAMGVLGRQLPPDAPLLATVRKNAELAEANAPAAKSLAATSAQPGEFPSPGPQSAGEMVATVPILDRSSPAVRRAVAVAMLLPFLIGLGIALLPGAFIGYRAWRRGYGFFTWFAAFVVSCSTPILTACLLATLPDRRREHRRRELHRWLEGELKNAGSVTATLTPVDTAGRSIGDARTKT